MKHIKLYEDLQDSKKFIWIHGLPGSGKSHLARELAKLEDGVVEILDDVGDISKIKSAILKSNVVIFSSPYFEEYVGIWGLHQSLETLLGRLEVEVEEWWFENDPQACIKNLLRRGDDHSIKANHIVPEIVSFSKRYNIPDGARVLPVWSDK